MKRVYVAGSYSANNVIDVLKNIGRGEKACAELFAMGYAPFCPWHDKDFVLRRPYEKFTIDQFYQYSLAWLEVSDCLYVLPGSESSNGTQAEILFAKRNGIPIYWNMKDLPTGD